MKVARATEGSPSVLKGVVVVDSCNLLLAERQFKRDKGGLSSRAVSKPVSCTSSAGSKPDIPLPGTGRKPAHCDSWYVPKFCSNCGKPVLRKGNCKRAICPDCSTTWRFDRVENIVKRLMSYKYEKGKRLRHFTVSPPERLVSSYINGKIDINYLFKEVFRTVRWKSPNRDSAGMVLFHPYRLTKEGKEKALELKQEKEDIAPGECGDWKALLTLDDWKDYVYFFPHFHVVVAIDRGKRWKEGNEKLDAGWIWKGIREVKETEDVLKVSMYLLSHLGVISAVNGKSNQAIRWFGDLSANSWCFEKSSRAVQLRVKSEFKRINREYEEAEDYSNSECLECGGELVDFIEAPNYWDKFSPKVGAKLFAVYLYQNSGKDPPRSLETEKEFFDWLEKEYPAIFSLERIPKP